MGHKGNGGIIHGNFGPDRVQVQQAMQMADMRAEIQRLQGIILKAKAMLDGQRGDLARLECIVCDLLGDAPRDIEEPSFSIPAVRVKGIAESNFRIQVLPRPDQSAVDVYLWTNERGDEAAKERLKASVLGFQKGPEEPTEIVLAGSIPPELKNTPR